MSIYEKRKVRKTASKQNKYSGVKESFSFFDLIIYFLIALIAIICLYPILNVFAISLSGYQEVLSNSVTWYPKNISFGENSK